MNIKKFVLYIFFLLAYDHNILNEAKITNVVIRPVQNKSVVIRGKAETTKIVCSVFAVKKIGRKEPPGGRRSKVMQMQEKTMVTDTLTGINGELVRYAEMIPQTENKELKQTLKQFRTMCEQSQEELYQIARDKTYYVPAQKATQEEVDHVKGLFTSQTL